ncbi:MAG: DsbE family thiol:disulfide interchange protein [Gammaproteobacteria bacterium]|nr:DsbE family thiol:disulfide interchange protein [Gammaproteobacteria bacterium]
MTARYLVPLAIFVVLLGFLAVGLKLDPREVPSPLIDRDAPAFDLPSVRDPKRTVGLADLKREEVSLFNVWASWCVSCRHEHPLLVELSRRNVVPIYGLNYKDSRSDAVRWLDRLGDPYRASAFDADGRVGIDWGVYGVPETFVVDRKGIIRHKHTGPISVKDWEHKLMPIIRQLQAEKG